MINLLPLKQKKSLHKLLVLRELAMFLAGVLSVAMVCVILLTPVYFFLETKSNSLNIEVNNLKNSESLIVDKNMNTTIDDINNKLSIFPDSFKEVYPTFDVIVPITKHKVPGVSITGISYEQKMDNVKTTTDTKQKPDLEVRGVAKNRLALLAFQKSLESDPAYSSVTVPISDFVKGKDISFSIIITTNI
ncbi:MAG: hypothetical protein ACR2IQ_01415 [Minisyncoccia bacterium]